MNTPAIHQALRLNKQAEEMAWLCFPDSELPEGINDLLRIAASPELLNEFADNNELNADELSMAIFNFIENVMLNEKNSDEKTLGTNKFSTSQTQKYHYQLLMKIYHPDLSTRPNADYYSSLITNAYQQVKTRENQQDVISFSEKRKASYNYYQATKKADTQISNAKTAVAIFSVIAICSLVAFTGKFFGDSNIELISDKNDVENVVQETNSDAQQVMKVSAIKPDLIIEPAKPSIKATNTALQALLKDLEIAYEDGNVAVIKPILANAPELKDQTEQQLKDKLENIFEITSERKMVLFDFNWTSASGILEGNGKFISRYQLVGEKKWLTREGTASVVAERTNNKLKVTQLVLQNQDINE